MYVSGLIKAIDMSHLGEGEREGMSAKVLVNETAQLEKMRVDKLVKTWHVGVRVIGT